MRRTRGGLREPSFFIGFASGFLKARLVITKLPIKATGIIGTAAVNQLLHALTPPLRNNSTDFLVGKTTERGIHAKTERA